MQCESRASNPPVHLAMQLNSPWIAYAGTHLLHPRTAAGCREAEDVKENVAKKKLLYSLL